VLFKRVLMFCLGLGDGSKH